MPVLDGFAVMRLLDRWMHGSTPVPIVVLTADITDETKHQALRLGARDFLTKPFDPEEVRLRVSNQLEMRQLQLRQKTHGDDLEERVHQRTHELELARLDLMRRLALAAEYRDGYTAGLLAEGLGLPAAMVERIRLAAPLHDIGKIAITDAILLKPDKLTAEEFDTIKSHTLIGARILGGSRSQLLRTAAEIALTHHERWDGRGYPRGLAGEQIPLPGRIVAVADVFDALTHERPYKPAWPLQEAVAEIPSQAGQFDPDVVGAFLQLDHQALLSGAKEWRAPTGHPLTRSQVRLATHA
jgi:putative two-component system response regulator